jgi:hypothetical protein
MPVVTVPCSPPGEPIAMTSSPTCTESESPNFAGVSPETPSAWITARSLDGSVPTTDAFTVLPSAKVTVSFSAPETTWLLVRMRPSAPMITPEPTPSAFAVRTFTWTTLSLTFSTTALTSAAVASEVSAVLVAGVAAGVVVSSPPTSAPTTPPTPPAASAAAASSATVLRRTRFCFGGWGGSGR